MSVDKPSGFDTDAIANAAKELADVVMRYDTALSDGPAEVSAHRQRIIARMRGFVLGIWGRPLDETEAESQSFRDGYLVGQWLMLGEGEGRKRERQSIVDNFNAAARRLRGKDEATRAERQNLRDFAIAIARREL